MQRQRQSLDRSQPEQLLLQNLKSLTFVNKHILMEKQFIMGYLLKSFSVPTTESLQILQIISQNLIDAKFNKLLSQQNFFALIVVLSDICTNPQKHKNSDLMEFYSKSVTALTQNQKYLHQKYFISNEQKEKQKKLRFQRFMKQQQQRQRQNGQIKRSKSYNLAECPICMVQITHDDISVLTCGHIIHKQCFQGCMKQNILKRIFH